MASPYVRARGNIRRPRRQPVRRARRTYKRRVRSTRRPVRGSTIACKCPGELSPSAKFALAQLDPFEPKCLGAKVPDSNTMPSVASSDLDQVSSVSPSSAGYIVGMAFRPTWGQAVINGNSLAATPTSIVDWGVSLNANSSARKNLNAFKAQFEATRPVAHAVRLVSQLSPTTATGFVHIGLSVESSWGASANNVWQFPTTVSEMTGLAYYKRVTLASLTQTPITVINKWIDERAFQYQDPDTYTSVSTSSAVDYNNAFQFSWCNIVILIEGAPTGVSPLSAEHLLLTEALPQKKSCIIGTQAAPNSPGTMSAVSTMSGETDFAHTEAQQESYISQGLSSLQRGASVAGTQVFDNVARPLLERVGYAAGMTAFHVASNMVSGRGGLPGVNSNPNRLTLG